MKRRLFWLLAIAGAAWLYLKRGARRPEPVRDLPAPPPAAPSDPADELRRKLDETKEREAPVTYPAEPDPAPAEILGVEQPAADSPGEESPAGDAPEPAAADESEQPSAPVVSEEIDARRREIHERARSAAEEMHGTSSDSPDEPH